MCHFDIFCFLFPWDLLMCKKLITNTIDNNIFSYEIILLLKKQSRVDKYKWIMEEILYYILFQWFNKRTCLISSHATIKSTSGLYIKKCTDNMFLLVEHTKLTEIYKIIALSTAIIVYLNWVEELTIQFH